LNNNLCNEKEEKIESIKSELEQSIQSGLEYNLKKQKEI
jgi:hypothetical protein